MTAKPAKPPIWATDGDNVADPAEGRDVSGWAVGDWLISSYINFLQHYAGAWLTWLDERIFDEKEDGTGDAQSLKIRPPVATPRGTMTASGSIGSSGDGGDLTAVGGDAKTSGDGGDATVAGGDGVWSNADGGGFTVSAGSTTGSGSAGVKLYATEGGASGAATRNPSQYLHADAANGKIALAKSLHIADANTPQIELAALSALPSAPPAQSIARVDDIIDSLYLRHNDGRWAPWPDIFFNDYTQEQMSIGPVTTQKFATEIPLPAEFLNVGTVLELLVLAAEITAIAGWSGQIRLGPNYGASVIVGGIIQDVPTHYHATSLTTIVFDQISGDNLSSTSMTRIFGGNPNQRYRRSSQFDRTVQQNVYFEVITDATAGTRDIRLDLAQARVIAWD